MQFDYDALLRGDIEGRYAAYAKAVGSSTAMGWVTPNEIRAREEMDPIDGGDKLYMSNRMMPAGTPPAVNNPPRPPAPGGGGFPQPPIAGGENGNDEDDEEPSSDGAPRNGRSFLMRT